MKKLAIVSGLVAAVVAMAGSVDAGRTSAEQLGGWGRPGKICWDEDGSARPCPPPPPPPPPDGGQPDESSDSLMKRERDPHDDSFCNVCHVNRTSEAAGPRTLRTSVLTDPPTFWRRHRDIATRIQNKKILSTLRDARALSPTLQKLMAARPAR